MRDKLRREELEDFIENHHVVYIRHHMDSTPVVYRKLIKEGLIALHYNLKKGISKDDLRVYEDLKNYENSGKNALKRLGKYCEEGAIVFADYSNPPETVKRAVNIGVLPEGSHYKVVSYEATPYFSRSKYPCGLVYKQVELYNYVILSYGEFEPFLAIQPRKGNMIHWREGENIVKFIYKKYLHLRIHPESIKIDMLLPTQQEVLCSEYLRIKAPKEIRLKYFLLPVGRGMKSIDIVGVNENIHLLAQVSFGKQISKIRRKIKNLKEVVDIDRDKFGRKYELVYFGPYERREWVNENFPDIKYISLEEVFEKMKDTGIIRDMLKIYV